VQGKGDPFNRIVQHKTTLEDLKLHWVCDF
jgi:hypothetical protein